MNGRQQACYASSSPKTANCQLIQILGPYLILASLFTREINIQMY
jgi:hypothetical protein